MARIRTSFISAAMLCVLAAPTMACEASKADSSLRVGMTKEEVAQQLVGCEGRNATPFGGYTERQKAQHEVWMNWNDAGPESAGLLLVFRDGKLAEWMWHSAASSF